MERARGKCDKAVRGTDSSYIIELKGEEQYSQATSDRVGDKKGKKVWKRTTASGVSERILTTLVEFEIVRAYPKLNEGRVEKRKLGNPSRMEIDRTERGQSHGLFQNL